MTRLRVKYAEESAKLAELQGEAPLVFPLVDGQAIAEVVENWTGIPAGRMRSDEIRNVLALQATMEQRVVGQSHAIAAVAQAIRTSRAGMTDPRKPLGVFLMVGPSGVGKTETALTLADQLYGGEQNLTTINMSEYKEEHKVSLLMGSPPAMSAMARAACSPRRCAGGPIRSSPRRDGEGPSGRAGHLLPGVRQGSMKDGEGREIDFKNTVIIMTSNAASDLITKLCADPETMPEPGVLAQALRPELEKYYKAAFLGRVTLVPYLPLTDAIIRQIVGLQLGASATGDGGLWRQLHL